ncbi:nitroreductase family protein [Micromonospora sp. NBC_01699]|uniref:Acg family FMN-binding oxidoreductase n=1 Tax=Micromonospora sp. NBC_01699 TaxID=2975984 RepID=UPI002E30E688|nr:nitroreductase family protein [Micromonospora sp. NBC_01699]
MVEPASVPERAPAAVLARAAVAAGYAPSVHNTQPWRWSAHPDRLELHAERDRQLSAADPQGRLLMISCGAALDHALVALRAQGWAAEADTGSDPDRPDLLATVTASNRTPVTPGAKRLFEALATRRTDRRPVSEQPVGAPALATIQRAVTGRARLQPLTREQVLELAAAADAASTVESADPAIRAELAYWTGRSARGGVGLTAGVLPGRAPRTTVPDRDFGRAGTLVVGSGHDRAATYLLLYGDDDEPASWLRAGEALSAAWLTAETLGVSVLPLSVTIEVAGTRQLLRRLLSGLGHPYLVLRLGIADPDQPGPPHTPRISPAGLVEIATL